jgi:hypothetical protein
MMPLRVNIVGPPDVATKIKASIAACHSMHSILARRRLNWIYDRPLVLSA